MQITMRGNDSFKLLSDNFESFSSLGSVPGLLNSVLARILLTNLFRLLSPLMCNQVPLIPLLVFNYVCLGLFLSNDPHSAQCLLIPSGSYYTESS